MTDQSLVTDSPLQLLIEQLKDKKPGNREEALHKLDKLKDPAAIPAIIDVLLNDTNANNRKYASIAIADIGDEGVVSRLLEALEKENETFIRLEIIEALGKLRSSEAVPQLTKALGDADSKVQYTALNALFKIGNPEVVNPILQALDKEKKPKIRSQIITTLGNLKDKKAAPKIEDILKSSKNEDEAVCRAAICALAKIGGEEAIPILVNVMNEDTFIKVKIRAAKDLGILASERVIEPLWRALFSRQKEELHDEVVAALQKVPNWEAKTKSLIEIIRNGKYQRADIPGAQIVSAINLSGDILSTQPHVLTDHLIRNATKVDKGTSDNLAAVIIASTGDDQTLAGDRINKCQSESGDSEEAFDILRIQIGGETALDPIIQTLSDDLHTYFRIPIKELNAETLKSWNKTIKYAQVGVLARMIMSVIVFIVGIMLLLVSSYQFMFGELNTAGLFGAGVLFVSGIGTTLLIIYTGPLREIREAVEDLGTASAAFIAYVHRVSQISHTFSFCYLKQKISFEEMKKSSELIRDAMNDTIVKLENRKKETSEEVIREVLKQTSTVSQQSSDTGGSGKLPSDNSATAE